MSNKMEIIIKFEDENGNEETKPVTVEVDFPSYKEFTNFRKDFNKLERVVSQARKEATEKAIESYMTGISKKTYERNNGIHGKISENEVPYKVEAELGKLDLKTHRINDKKRTVFDT